MRALHIYYDSTLARPDRKQTVLDGDGPLFLSGPALRRMRVVLDANAIEGKHGEGLDLLIGLLTHPYVDCWSYADDGPPVSLERRDEGWGEYVPGWLVVKENRGQPRSHAVTFPVEGGAATAGVRASSYVEMAENDKESRAYLEMTAEEGRKRRAADAFAIRVAADMGSDVFITDRPYLHITTLPLARDISVLTPEDALPIVGLYLRRQEEFITWRSTDGTGTATANRGLFYWVAARALLPQAWRWMAACVHEAIATNNDGLALLAQSLPLRIDQALRARDDAIAALSQPQNNDTADEALAALDRVLICLMGAVDVSARVAHLVLGFDEDRIRQAAWQRDGAWRRMVMAKKKDLTDLLQIEAHGDAIAILNTLRNTVHGAALHPMALSEDVLSRTDTVVGLPADQAVDLLTRVDRQGGRESWGIQEYIPGVFHAEIDVLIERLLPLVLDFLNDVMRLTPVENLANAKLTEENMAHYASDPRSPFREVNQRLVLLQLGLSGR